MCDLTDEQKAMAINLALGLECGVYSMDAVLRVFFDNKEMAEKIAYFWLNFNDVTKGVLDSMVLYRQQLHLENCYRRQATDFPEIENI